MRGATDYARPDPRVQSYFNPRSCARSDVPSWACCAQHPHFNPRSCARSDLKPSPSLRSSLISTHAPVRGATQLLQHRDLFPEYFNPRSCARSDFVHAKARKGPKISTHAPVRGATGCCAPANLNGFISTHAPVRGATCAWWRGHWASLNFNPRSCARSDRTPGQPQAASVYFNPRSCARSDGRAG